jgi:hypothetical protein
MEPEDLTIRLLQEIRDEVRRSSDRTEVRFEKMDQRSEVIETMLRDLAQQLVMLARGIKTALEHRGTTESRLDVLEKQSGH